MTHDSNTTDPRVEAAAAALWEQRPMMRTTDGAPRPWAEVPAWSYGARYRDQARVALVAADAVAPRPRTIMERHEDNGPDELAPLSVVLSAGKPAIMQHDGTFMDYDGTSWDTWEMTYPLTVIHEPKTEAAA